MRVKGISGSTQAPFCQTGFLRPFRWRNTVKDDGSDPFIQALFWCPTPLLEQMDYSDGNMMIILANKLLLNACSPG